jgi:hypothetical protein
MPPAKKKAASVTKTDNLPETPATLPAASKNMKKRTIASVANPGTRIQPKRTKTIAKPDDHAGDTVSITHWLYLTSTNIWFLQSDEGSNQPGPSKLAAKKVVNLNFLVLCFTQSLVPGPYSHSQHKSKACMRVLTEGTFV